MTVGEIIRKIKERDGIDIPDGKTCDILTSGSMDMEVRKIACTFMATVDVIREASAQGINFIITHEPTWFTGMDSTFWLENDPVYQEKKKLLEENHITVWRYHDHMHAGKADGIYQGFDREFGWENYRVKIGESDAYTRFGTDRSAFWKHFGQVYELPETTLAKLAGFFREKAGMEVVQIVGNPAMPVRRVSVLVGGGSLGLGMEEAPMIQMLCENVDVAICGDITEWTLSAYVRDASMLGMNKGMLVLGHERSEEWGMKHMTGWLTELAGGVRTVFLDAKEPFTYLV